MNKSFKRTCLFLIVLITWVPIFADNGSSVFGFMDIPVSARVNALGGVNISLVERDLSITNQNPALLGPEMDKNISINYMRYIKDVNLGNAQYALALNENGAISFGAQFVNYGNFKMTTEDNLIIGDFSAKDMLFNAMIGYNINQRWRGGANAKIIYSAYETYTSFALAVDLGLNYFNENSDFSFSITANNLGGQLKSFDEVRESLPFDLRIGITKALPHAPFRFSFTAFNLTDWNDKYIDKADSSDDTGTVKKDNFAKKLFRHVLIGVEYLPTDNFYIALGYNYKKREQFSSGGGFMTGFSAGAGISIKKININASIAQHHISGTSFMMGLNLLLNK